MKIVRAQDVAPGDWDDACERSSSAWLFHRASWVALEERFFDHRSLSFAVVDGDRILGVQPLYFTEVGIGWIERLVHCGIHRHTGLALVDDLPAASVNEASATAMRAVLDSASAEDADRIQLNVQNLAPVNLTSARDEIPLWVREYGFQLGLHFSPNGMLPVPGMVTCCADQLVRLDLDEPDLFARLSESCRRAVRKAQKGNVEFEVATGDADVADYWRLAQLAAHRTGETLPPLAYYEAVVRGFGPRRQCALLFARHGGCRVAGLLLAMDKRGVSYLGGVSDPDYLPMRVNDFLHWSAIVWAKSLGAVNYRLGPAFPEVPADWPIARVSRFKTKFGGRSLTTIQGSWFRRPEKYLNAGLEQLTARCAEQRGPDDREA